MAAAASIVIPTRDRLPYLEVALASVREQAARAGAEVLVVDDGGRSDAAARLARRLGARYEPHERPLGLNAARNTGVQRSGGELVVFLDDDVRACEGWLAALLAAASAHPDVDVFAGRLTARLEGRAPRSCGREGAPVTTLDLGGQDVEASFAWGANMAIRRGALERVGPFDVALGGAGDEQEWQERLLAAGGARPLYVAGAWVEHRRSGPDAELRSLCRAARARGAAARRFDVRRGRAPTRRAELATLAGCAGHVALRRCPAGLTMVAHSWGRLVESLAPAPPPPAEDFLSGQSGTVGGLDAVLRRGTDELARLGETLSGRPARLARAARERPPRRSVLVLGIRRPEHAALADAAAAELARSRHDVHLHTTEPGGLGKFENLDRLLAAHPAEPHDWLLVVDDDVELPGGFLDRFLFLCERYSLALAQPAHRRHSHAAWQVTRRRPGSAVRETRFVEIGPVTAFARETFADLLPFPRLRMGWGLDLHWAAVARERGWRCGVVDAVAIAHRAAPAAASYPRESAIAEARSFLRDRPHLSAREAQVTLAVHRGW